MFSVDLHSGVPVYRQIIDQIRFQVASGVLRPGDELPSTRALSAELEVNPMTVSKAYSMLERDGIVDRRPGMPLVIRLRRGRTVQRERIEQLRATLTPAVRAAQQLEIDPEDAIQEFRDMLDGGGRSDQRGKR